jgi:hypothetical protein
MAPVLATGLFLLSPSQARTAAAAETMTTGAAAIEPAKSLTRRDRPKAWVKTASTTSDPGCLAARRKLWTDAGWIVRRVTSCR